MNKESERLRFIINLKDERGFYEVINSSDADKRNHIGIGAHCNIHEYVSIGTDGHGFERDDTGTLVKFPHYEGVSIGHNVEIRPFTSIARGTLNPTLIGNGTKIASHCAIGHGSKTGKHVRIGASCVVGGNTVIGDYSSIEMGVRIFSHLTIGSHTHIHAGSLVTKDCESDTCYQGNPAGEVIRCDKHR